MQQRHPTSQPPPAYHVAKAMASPVYPAVSGKSPAEELGAQLMSKYTWGKKLGQSENEPTEIRRIIDKLINMDNSIFDMT